MPDAKVNVKVMGKVVYPKLEKGKKHYCILLNDKGVAELVQASKEVNPDVEQLKIGEVEVDDKTYKCVNVKTNAEFKVPVFDKDGNAIDDAYHGAKAIVSITLKEYEYKKKKGITAYLGGFVVIEQGEKAGVSYDSMLQGFEDELVGF